MFSSKLVSLLCERGMIEEEDRELYLYGINLLTERLLGLFSVLVISAVFGELLCGVGFYIFYSLLRKFAGGYHAGKFSHCYIMSCLVMLCCVILAKLSFAGTLSVIMTAVSVPIVLILAPQEYETRPLEEREVLRYRRLSKITTVFEVYAFILLYFFSLYSLCICIGCSLSLTAVLLLVQKARGTKKYAE
ncbi:MAG: accessory gene regulator B family protein [Ruminococcus sp.]